MDGRCGNETITVAAAAADDDADGGGCDRAIEVVVADDAKQKRLHAADYVPIMRGGRHTRSQTSDVAVRCLTPV